jgi:hypothetical protein
VPCSNSQPKLLVLAEHQMLAALAQIQEGTGFWSVCRDGGETCPDERIGAGMGQARIRKADDG